MAKTLSDQAITERTTRWGGPAPRIVCLCGSTRFYQTFQEANLAETLEGRIVLSIGAAIMSDDDHFGHLPEAERDALKRQLDELHLRKIDLADEVLVINCEGYIGASTSREIAYAMFRGKPVRWRSICGACHGPYHGGALLPQDCERARKALELRLLEAAQEFRLAELG